MAFIIDQALKIVFLKIFGTTRPKFLKFTTSDEEGYYDPYFETSIDSKGNKILKNRQIPINFPNELENDVIYIKKTCYLMDESLFGLKMSNFVNKLFGSKKAKKVKEDSDIDIDIPTTPRKLGFGFGPLIQIFPFFGNYIVFAINCWLLICMIEIGIGYKIKFEDKRLKLKHYQTKKFLHLKSIGKMIFNIMIDFGIGFIPLVGGFISIIHRSSSRNLAIFWKSMEDSYSISN